MKKIDYKWTALGLLWVAFFLQQGTRQLFGPSVPAICQSFGADMSLSMSSLAAFYLVGALVVLLARVGLHKGK